MSDVLEHLHDPATTLRATARVLRTGGRLVAFSPLEGQRFSFYRGYQKIFGDDLYRRTKEHIQAYSDASLKALVEDQFEITEQRYAYHLIGHLMDATLFAAMQLPAIGADVLVAEPLLRRGRTNQRGEARALRAGAARGQLARIQGVTGAEKPRRGRCRHAARRAETLTRDRHGVSRPRARASDHAYGLASNHSSVRRTDSSIVSAGFQPSALMRSQFR